VTTPSTDEPTAGRAARVLGGRYVLGRRVGAGGMATILRAEDPHMERTVAIKVLHRHLADDPEVRARFAAEARHAASLAHPNVVAVYDQGEADLPYIVMELVDGPSLRQVLVAHGPMDPAQVLAVVAPLCGALQTAHDQGLVHRDVKPENVLVTPDGMPKLADFGIARVMAATSHTATGTLVGSVHYLAPELVGGVEATPASDQYALAVVAWELLTGRKPLPAETPMAIALRHASEDIPPASRYAPEVPPALDAVLARATSRDPGVRYPSMRELAAALHAAVAEDPAPVTAVADDGVVRTLILPPADHETLALAAHALDRQREAAAALERRRAGGRPARQPRREPPPTGRREGRPLAVVGIGLLVLALVGAGAWLVWDQLIAPVATVPGLVGVDRGAAQEAVRDLDLRLEIDAEEHRLAEPVGQVIGQDPPEGAQLRAGGVVRVVLSLGPRVVEMPDLLGQPYDDVRPLLEADAFDVDLAREHSDDVPAGAVMGQAPEPGEAVAQGSAVSITVSLGIEQVAVPRMAGLDLPAAEAAAADARLGPVTVVEEWSDEVPEAGVVIRQSLRPGEEVDKGTAVELVVSRGPLTVDTPDVGGLDPEEAAAIIEDLELVVGRVTEPQGTLGPFAFTSVNRVERQVPAAGDPIERGQTVTIYYFTPR
jgi:beta-lactam-binding protein with PASTA domain